MYGCQQNLISPDKDLKAVLEFLCSEASNLINCGTYYARQLFFKTGRIPSRAKLHKVLGTDNRNIHYKAFYSDTAQQILTTVAESFQSYLGLLTGIKEGTVTQHPRLPGYRQGGLALVTFTGRSVKIKDGMLRRPARLRGRPAAPRRQPDAAVVVAAAQTRRLIDRKGEEPMRKRVWMPLAVLALASNE